jgi:hypothetical protein
MLTSMSDEQALAEALAKIDALERERDELLLQVRLAESDDEHAAAHAIAKKLAHEVDETRQRLKEERATLPHYDPRQLSPITSGSQAKRDLPKAAIVMPMSDEQTLANALAKIDALQRARDLLTVEVELAESDDEIAATRAMTKKLAHDVDETRKKLAAARATLPHYDPRAMSPYPGRSRHRDDGMFKALFEWLESLVDRKGGAG